MITDPGLYFNISAIKESASSLALGISPLNGNLSFFGNLNPTWEASLYPSSHSSFVGVPLYIKM